MKKIIEWIRYWGIINLISKAYEKLIIDHKRFQPRENRRRGIRLPDYKAPEINNMIDKKKSGMTIFYLVHQFYPRHQGGTERFVLNLAQRMQREGNQVIIFTIGEGRDRDYPYHIDDILYQEIEVEQLKVIEFRYRKTPQGLMYKNINIEGQSLYKFAAYFLDEYKPDLVHCAYPQPMAAFLKCCIDKKQPYLVTLTDFNSVCHYATMIDKDGELCGGSLEGRQCKQVCNTWIVKDFQKRYKNAAYLLEHACYVTTPSCFSAAMLYKEFNKITPIVIPHGINKQFSSNERGKGEGIRYAYVGKLSALKGVHLLIKAFLEADTPGILDIYGSGHPAYRSKLQKLAGNSDKIIFYGSLSHEDTVKMYQSHDVIVIPSMCYETYNYVVREAISCGCFVVGADMGAIGEAIVEGENGITFEAGNQASLVRALREAYGRKSTIINSFATIEEEVDTYYELYNGCLK